MDITRYSQENIGNTANTFGCHRILGHMYSMISDVRKMLKNHHDSTVLNYIIGKSH